MMRWVIYLVLLPVLLPTQLINGSGWILPLVFRVGFILSTLVKGKFLSVNSLWSKPFPGHACGVPPEAAPTIEYFKGLVERHSKIMSLRHLDFIFVQTNIFEHHRPFRCSEPKNCSSKDCDPYASVFETANICFIGVCYFFSDILTVICIV